MSKNYCDAYPKDDINIFKGLRVLVVDDTKDILFLVTYLLESYGIQVMTANNASSALSLIKRFPVDLLISDLAMPWYDGYWLIQKIRQLTQLQNREIPAIAFSSSAEAKAREKALAAGFQTYIEKPSHLEQLITEVAKLLLRSGKSSPKNLAGQGRNGINLV
ncbi:response regulator [Komarekiella sp. 'clone 1']|uniref:Response regulator n=1 Tax=Komarekiella delphini-convector SJRDD-AB1 TaxID=2593771 RepID=A0AA40VU16_9NOST|nr:response regulator [Komarekiella delphini-convector]MBD6619725.1 response regulator [Komarekiella delphini-convector SJRDD-AB1]